MLAATGARREGQSERSPTRNNSDSGVKQQVIKQAACKQRAINQPVSGHLPRIRRYDGRHVNVASAILHPRPVIALIARTHARAIDVTEYARGAHLAPLLPGNRGQFGTAPPPPI
ncbi:unnamed protein product, partial [Iphiclides podalirius]